MRSRNARELVGTRKKILILAMVGLALIGAVNKSNVLAKTIQVDPPVYRVNTKLELMITRIIPEESYLEMVLKRSEGMNEYAFPSFIHVGFGIDPTDYDLSLLESGSLEDEIIAVNALGTMLSSSWNDEETVGVTAFRSGVGVSLADNESGRMFYTVSGLKEELVVGRIDYSRCTHSSVFLSGMATECRVEMLEDGKIQYQPYNSFGERIEIPEAEDAELTAAIESVVYELGDWPPIWKTVSDDPEPVPSEPTSNEPEPTVSGETTLDEPEPTTNISPAPVLPETTPNSIINEGSSQNENKEGERNTETVSVQIAGVAGQRSEENKGDSGNNGNNFFLEVVEGETGSENAESSKDAKGVKETSGDKALDGDDMGVPELGKETGMKPSLTMAILAGLAAILLIAVWWFLFFGKNQPKDKRKEKK